jgi:O-antigen biosynthesis protein WbqP
MRSWRRAFDLVVAAPGLLLAAPVILVAALGVVLTSPGPAFYSQVRLGRGAVPFRCHKLRTMHSGSPSVPTHEAAAHFITPLGRVLRRFKLDELPQLWNVLKGEMSIIGPRPCLPTQDELIRHRQRLGVFRMRPGITGLTQVRGIDMSSPLRCAESDAEYLRTRSVALDLRILARTLTGP